MVKFPNRIPVSKIKYLSRDTDIFSIFSTDIWSAADIRLSTDTDSKICFPKYLPKFTNEFWLKLVWIAYNPTYGSLQYCSEVD